MAERYMFFNSQLVDGEYDREYQAQDFADYFGTVLTSGFISSDGEMGLSSKVESGTLNTIIAPGKAIIKGHWYENTSDLTLEHPIPEADNDRIDRIVLRLDRRNSERNVKLHVVEGTPSETPQAPEVRRDNYIYELGVARIRVRANTSSLEKDDLIDDRLNDDVGGIVNSMITVPHAEFKRMWDEFFTDVQVDVVNEWNEFIEGVKDLGFTTRVDFNQHVEDDERHATQQDRNRWDSQLNTKRKSKQNQTFEKVEKHRDDGTLFSTSVLSDINDNNDYLTRTYTEYEEDGETILYQVIYDLKYDNQGDWLEEVKRDD